MRAGRFLKHGEVALEVVLAQKHKRNRGMVCCSLETEGDCATLPMLETDSLPGSVAASKKKNPFTIRLRAGAELPTFFCCRALGALLTFLSQLLVNSARFGTDAV